MWEPAISGMGNAHNCAPKLQVYPPIFSLTPKASGSTRLQSWEVHKGLLHNQYQKKSEYELDEKGKVSFFKKNRNNQVNIWALIDITDMDRNDVLLLNDKFAEFWINEMSREEKKKDIRFTFVIQVDEMNDYLQEIFYESQGIFMDKHRSRLPVLYVRKHDILKVKWADDNSKYISINKEMRKELKKIYDDSEIESINS